MEENFSLYDMHSATFAMPPSHPTAFVIPPLVVLLIMAAVVWCRVRPGSRLARWRDEVVAAVPGLPVVIASPFLAYILLGPLLALVVAIGCVAWWRISGRKAAELMKPRERMTRRRFAAEMAATSVFAIALPLAMVGIIDAIAYKGTLLAQRAGEESVQTMIEAADMDRVAAGDVTWVAPDEKHTARAVSRAVTLGIGRRIVEMQVGDVAFETTGPVRAALVQVEDALLGTIVCLYQDGDLVRSTIIMGTLTSLEDIPGAEPFHATCPETDAEAHDVVPSEGSIEILFTDRRTTRGETGEG